MKISILMVSVILIAAIFLPLAYLVTKSARTERKIKKTLQKFGAANQLSFEDINLHGNLILALDHHHKKLVYTTRKTLMSNVQIIDLLTLTACQVKALKEKGKALEWVSLELTNAKEKENIIFYEEQQDDGPVTDPLTSLHLAEKWKKLIQPLLKIA